MSFISDHDTDHGGISARFPRRCLPPGAPSEAYTSAELRLYRYVQDVLDGSDDHLAELTDAYARLAQIIRHNNAIAAELDERTDPKDAPCPIIAKPAAPAPASVPLCRSVPREGGVATADCCDCGGR